MFIRGPNPIWSEFDLTGQIFDDTYFASFKTNTLPYVPQAVYQDVNGLTPWADPLRFQPNGCLPNNLYFNPALVYRIEFRQGPDDSYPLIGNPIENYTVGSGGSTNSTPILTAGNLITNPQFSDLYFGITPASAGIPTLNITTAGTYQIAPGWSFVVVGTGTATLSKVTISGDNNDPGNPPYALNIVTNGFSSARLIQTLSNNGGLFSGGAVSISFDATVVGANEHITVSFIPSTITGIPPTIFSGDILSGNLSAYAGFNPAIPASTNSDSGTAAYVTIVFNLQGTGNITLTNIQVLGQSINLPSTFTASDVPAFNELTYAEIVNAEYHLDKDPLFYKQIPSYLVAWDFPLNPAQFAGTARAVAAQAIGANKSYYAWDQTILFQSANSGITVSSGPAGDLKLLAAAAGKIAVIQYLDQIQARKILNDIISVNLSAVSTVAATGTIPVTISLWYTKDVLLPNIKSTGSVPTLSSLVATLDANGKPATFNGNWTEVTPLNGEEAFCAVASSSTTNFHDYSFNGYWDLAVNADANLATFFAIVIGTGSITMNDFIRINSVGLYSGSIATRPAPQTEDQVLRECEYYYEQSFESGTDKSTPTQVGASIFPLQIHTVTGNDFVYYQSFPLTYRTIKNTVLGPTVRPDFYSTIQATPLNKIDLGIINHANPPSATYINTVADTNWTIGSQNTKQIIMFQASDGGPSGGLATQVYNQGLMYIQYVVDCRLGR